jgi:hypothetical protein
MRRLLSLSLLAFAGLAACDGGTGISPLAPELPVLSAPVDPVFAAGSLPVFEPPEGCPVAVCLVDPTTLVRATKAPTHWAGDFDAEEGQEAELVVRASSPKTTTLKAFLNGEKVLLPSAFPRSGSDEVRVSLTLLAENHLELRLSAKPGSQVAFWIELVQGDEVEPSDPTDPGNPQEPVATFFTTSEPFHMGADLNAACAAQLSGSVIADWNDVVEAVGAGASDSDILGEGYAFVLNGGAGTYQIFMLGTFHYAVSASGPFNGMTYGTTGVDLTLTGHMDPQPVLCRAPTP